MLVDGVDVRDVTLESLRGQIGFVMQDSVLFSRHRRARTSRTGAPTPPTTRSRPRRRAAQADEFIARRCPTATTRASASAA